MDEKQYMQLKQTTRPSKCTYYSSSTSFSSSRSPYPSSRSPYPSSSSPYSSSTSPYPSSSSPYSSSRSPYSTSPYSSSTSTYPSSSSPYSSSRSPYPISSSFNFTTRTLTIKGSLLLSILLLNLLAPVFSSNDYPSSGVSTTSFGRFTPRFDRMEVTNNTAVSQRLTGKKTDSCDVANIKCALRSGCGMALQNYMLDCADLINGKVTECPESCSYSLLILTSTEEGRELMECYCTDDYCSQTKSRMEVCREKVLAVNADNDKMSCNLAHLICSANSRCSTAISYYDKFCKRMFMGRSCSSRCKNSIAILKRQDMESRLENCECDGTEPFDCVAIKKNMARLCFHRTELETRTTTEDVSVNEVDTETRNSSNKSKSARMVDSKVLMYLFLCLLFLL